MKNAYMATLAAKKIAEEKALQEDAVNLYFWLSIIALNEEFGIGGERAARYAKRLEGLAEQFGRDCEEIDRDTAIERLRRRAEQAIGGEVRRVD